jgi:hypothetical protein
LLIAQLESRYWTRRPEDIADDPPRGALHAISDLSDIASPGEDAADALDVAPTERAHLDRVDQVIADHIQVIGPAALLTPAVQAHLQALWDVANDAAVDDGERRRAAARWRWIMSNSAPDLRRRRARNAASPTRIASAVTETERAIREVRAQKWRGEALLIEKLSARLKGHGWLPPAIKNLASAIRGRDRHEIRRLVHLHVARRYQLDVAGLNELVAAGRKIARLRAAAEGGHRRYQIFAAQRDSSTSHPGPK